MKGSSCLAMFRGVLIWLGLLAFCMGVFAFFIALVCVVSAAAGWYPPLWVCVVLGTALVSGPVLVWLLFELRNAPEAPKGVKEPE